MTLRHAHVTSLSAELSDLQARVQLAQREVNFSLILNTKFSKNLTRQVSVAKHVRNFFIR